jgi:hypothetical protein
MKYSACTGRIETWPEILKSKPPPTVRAKLFWGSDCPIPEVVAMPPNRACAKGVTLRCLKFALAETDR